ncbi:hypothetical protein RY831_28185 [Noviherbaspirillum sp. CPCC 100848]|uniref:Response regulatory domain-containing protein n=1 Tax=Noviherbaspirillum album TaxID=3080276 RepID=A0ABU6JJ13_9BURK|nr:hypothetical protein [Noviherbaspirillum sp. CPCC 100848]MEC4723044.1 hypothetical protein [Noviherbaspirillum sp. CPCC 100848]
MASALRAVKHGSYESIEKPLDAGTLAPAVMEALETNAAQQKQQCMQDVGTHGHGGLAERD